MSRYSSIDAPTTPHHRPPHTALALTLRFTSTSFWSTQASVRTRTRLRSCSTPDLDESMVEEAETRKLGDGEVVGLLLLLLW